jgi:UDP-glucose 4-epimerase
MLSEAQKKAVVTGGAGFIGSHLVVQLVADGYDVHVVDNYAAGKKESRLCAGATYHDIDIVDLEKLRPLFAGATYVFHLAALPRVQFSIDHPQEAHNANVVGTFNVLLAARDQKVAKVIYSASSSAYGDSDTLPLVETMPAHPKSPYGLHKYIGELNARLFSDIYGLPTVSLRYFNVYGPGGDAADAYALVMPKFLEMRMQGKAMVIFGDGTQTRDFTHIHDVVRANIAAATRDTVGKGEVINIGAGNNVSINTVAELIGGPVEYAPARLEPHDTLADNSLAKKLLGWEPQVSLEEGIAELKKLSHLE